MQGLEWVHPDFEAYYGMLVWGLHGNKISKFQTSISTCQAMLPHSSWDFPDHVLRPCTPFKEGTLRPVQFHRGTRNRSSRSAARAVVAVVFGVMVVLRVVVVGPCVLTS